VSHFCPNLILGARHEPTRVEALTELHSWGWLLAQMAVKNTLAYSSVALITTVKGFTALAPNNSQFLSIVSHYEG